MLRSRRAMRLALFSVFVATGVGLLALPAVAEPSASPSVTPTEPEKDPAGEGDAHQLVITVHGTAVRAGGSKTGMLSIYNQGPNNVVDADIEMDLGELDTQRVDVGLLTNNKCEKPGKTTIRCRSIAERTTLDLSFLLTPAEGAKPGPAGTITVVIKDSLHDGVSDAPHKFAFPVTIAAGGPDLSVWAPDQPFHADGSTGKIKRGEDGELFIVIVNRGDQTVKGVRVITKLVKGATFTDLDNCTTSSDRATLTCDFTDLSLIPDSPAVKFTPGVRIADDAKSPKGWPDLPGNTVTVEPLAVEPPDAVARRTTTLPEGIQRVSLASLDIDATDNADDFTIMLAEADSTGGGGQGGGTGGGGLPITGSAGTSIAAGAVVLLIAGGVFFFVARRRKVRFTA